MSDAEWTISTLKALVEQRFTDMDKALEIQTKELSRRLDSLNHAHEKAVEIQHTYVPREVFDHSTQSIAKEFSDYKTATSRALVLTEGVKSGSSAVIAYVIAGLSLAVAIAAILIR